MENNNTLLKKTWKTKSPKGYDIYPKTSEKHQR